MTLVKYVKPRDDVFDETLDEAMAPEIHQVFLGETSRTYLDPSRFLEITHITEGLRLLVGDVARALCGEPGGRHVVILPSLFGGGKTHALILLYHVVKNPGVALKHGLITEKQAECLSGAKVVVIGGKDRRTAPSPLEELHAHGYSVKTLWGYLAHLLGKYALAEEHDKKLIPPEFKGLLDILSPGPVLILIDELAHYLGRLRRGYEDYVNKVYLFLEVLAEASSKTRASLVLTVPAEVEVREERGERELRAREVEGGYEEIVNNMLRRVGRYSLPVRAPISSNVDLVNVFRKRLFERVDSAGASEIQAVWNRLREHYRDSLIDLSDLGESYPFHPKYIEILNLLVDKLGMQRTRDAIRITRMVVRRLWSSGLARERSLIVPSDISVEDDRFRSVLFAKRDVAQFSRIADLMVRAVRSYPAGGKEHARELAFQLVSYVFLATYTYNPGLSCRSEYPSDRDAASSVDFKYLYIDRGLTPPEAIDILNSLASGELKIHGLLGAECSPVKRFWFTQYPDPIEKCRSIARQIPDSDPEVMDRLREYIANMLRGEIDLESGGKGRRGRKVEATDSRFKVFDRILVFASDRIDVDDARYLIASLLEEPSEDDLRGIVFEREKGRPREHRNTIIVIHPRGSSDKRKQAVERIKEEIGCSKIDLEKEYPDEIQRKVVREIINNHMNMLKGRIYTLLLQFMNSLTYPSGDGEVKTVDLRRSGESLLSQAITTLVEESKVPEQGRRVDFEVLDYYLKQIGIDLSKGAKPIRIDYLSFLPYKDPRMPMFTREEVEAAIIDGVERGEIGIRRADGKILFREVEGLSGISIKNYRLEKSDEVLPWKLAVEEQINQLLEMEKIEEGGKGCEDGVEEIYFVVSSDLVGDFKLRELRDKRPSDYQEIFKNNKISMVRKCEKRTFTIDIEPREVSAEPGEEIKVKVKVLPVGGFNGEVKLGTKVGSLAQSTGTPYFETLWFIKAPEDLGDHVYKLIAISGRVEREAAVLVKVRRKGEPSLLCIEDLGRIGNVPREYRLVSFEASIGFAPLERTFSKIVGEVVDELDVRVTSQTAYGRTEGSIVFNNIGLREADILVRDLRNVLGVLNTTITLTLKVSRVKAISASEVEEQLKDLKLDRIKVCFKP